MDNKCSHSCFSEAARSDNANLQQRVEKLEFDVATLKRGIRIRSSICVCGLPLYEIAVGPDLAANEVRGHARGFIAIGDIATGVVAIGGFARGFIAIGGLALGVLSIGGCAIGLAVALGGFAAGAIAIGGMAIGINAAGGLAFGL